MKGFLEFIREQGVIGLAVGFILGGAVTKLITSLVQDIVSPVLAIGLHNLESLKDAYWQIGSARIMWGNFLNVLLDFLIVAAVVYVFVRVFRLDRLDKKKG